MNIKYDLIINGVIDYNHIGTTWFLYSRLHMETGLLKYKVIR